MCCCGLPRWLSGKESICQCKRCRFYPWVRKIPWSRKWQPAPVFLCGKFHGQRSLVGYSSQGCKELDTTEGQSTHLCCSHRTSLTPSPPPTPLPVSPSASLHRHTTVVTSTTGSGTATSITTAFVTTSLPSSTPSSPPSPLGTA